MSDRPVSDRPIRRRETMAPARPKRDIARSFVARVTDVTPLTPHMTRITVQAPELADFVPVGPDEYLGMMFPRTAESPLVIPESGELDSIRALVAAIPESERPDLRWYTVRAHRPELTEVDIDFVVHGDEGPGTRFASRARVGDVVGIRECSAVYAMPGDARTRILVGDESSLPAIARILETTDCADTQVFIEVADASERHQLAGDVVWVERGARAPGAALEAAVRAAEIAADVDYVWLCGERQWVQNIRRHLADERGVSKARITFSGYWRIGEARL